MDGSLLAPLLRPSGLTSRADGLVTRAHNYDDMDRLADRTSCHNALPLGFPIRGSEDGWGVPVSRFTRTTGTLPGTAHSTSPPSSAFAGARHAGAIPRGPGSPNIRANEARDLSGRRRRRVMSKVTSDVSMSLDGFITDPDASVGTPLEGNDPGRLSDWQFAGLARSGSSLRGESPDCRGVQFRGRRSQAQTHHPDSAGSPCPILEDLDLEPALRRLRDSEDQAGLGPIDAFRAHGTKCNPRRVRIDRTAGTEQSAPRRFGSSAHRSNVGRLRGARSLCGPRAGRSG